MAQPAPSIRTPEAIVSYPNVLKPRPPMTDQKTGAIIGREAYSCALIWLVGQPARFINPGQPVSLDELKQAVAAEARRFFGDRLEELVKSGTFRSPFRTDAKAKGYPEGSVFVNVTTNQRPGVVSRYRGPDGGPAVLSDAEIERMVYPGAIVRATLRPFAYDKRGNRGVSLALNNLQWLGDGPRLDNRRAATEEFEGLEDAADLSETESTTEVLRGVPVNLNAPRAGGAPSKPLDLASLL